MIEIRIPKEITEYKEKFLFGLTMRKFFSLAAALAICVPLFIFGREYISEDILSWIIILIAVPIMAFGWFSYHGMYFETFAKCVFEFYTSPQKRPYKELNTFWSCREMLIDEQIAMQRAEAEEKRKEHSRKDVRNKRRKK